VVTKIKRFEDTQAWKKARELTKHRTRCSFKGVIPNRTCLGIVSESQNQYSQWGGV